MHLYKWPGQKCIGNKQAIVFPSLGVFPTLIGFIFGYFWDPVCEFSWPDGSFSPLPPPPPKICIGIRWSLSVSSFHQLFQWEHLIISLILWCLWCSIVTCDIQCKREGFLQRIKDEEGEGCNIYGFIEVNKVAGNFHFAPGKSFHQSGVHVHDLLAFQKDSFNVSYDHDDSGCFIIDNTPCILWK